MEYVSMGRPGLKVSGPCLGTMSFSVDAGTGGGLSATGEAEASLRRLGTDYIDLHYCHRSDPDTPAEETMATLDGFVTSGKVRYLGCVVAHLTTVSEPSR
jgi:aryl-alcohol dehydrogenase-like predicted oxidoreductase